MNRCFLLLIVALFFVSGGNNGFAQLTLDEYCYKFTVGDPGHCFFVEEFSCDGSDDCEIWEEFGSDYGATWADVESTWATSSTGYYAETVYEVECSRSGFCIREPDPNDESGYLCTKESVVQWHRWTRLITVLNTGDPCGVGTN